MKKLYFLPLVLGLIGGLYFNVQAFTERSGTALEIHNHTSNDIKFKANNNIKTLAYDEKGDFGRVTSIGVGIVGLIDDKEVINRRFLTVSQGTMHIHVQYNEKDNYYYLE